MSLISELNIQTTIVCFKIRAKLAGEIPQRVALVWGDREASAYAWRSLAIQYLEEREKKKQTVETIHLGNGPPPL